MLKILVVDDSATVRLQVGRALQGAGFETVDAVDGLDALEKMSANLDISLVICDVNMPRMGGIEFLEAYAGKLRAPVLMLTTEGQPQLIQRAKTAGARAWIIKPFKAETLVAAARKLTEIAA